MRILLTEDELRMAVLLDQALTEEGHQVDVAHRGETAVELVDGTDYDAILLDVMLPGIDGFETCRRMRAKGVGTPILMLTSRGDVDDRVRGLDSGADDYLLKPFELQELFARVRALSRRGPADFMTRIAIGDLVIEANSLSTWRGTAPIALTTREFAILELLMRNPGRVVSKLDILDAAWDGDVDHRSNVIEVLIKRIRDKIDKPFGTDTIETVRGTGYRLRRP